jgi:hypothetical protein
MGRGYEAALSGVAVGDYWETSRNDNTRKFDRVFAAAIWQLL